MLHLWLLGQHVHNHLDLKIFTGGGLETEMNGFMNLKLFTVNKITPSHLWYLTGMKLSLHSRMPASPSPGISPSPGVFRASTTFAGNLCMHHHRKKNYQICEGAVNKRIFSYIYIYYIRIFSYGKQKDMQKHTSVYSLVSATIAYH